MIEALLKLINSGRWISEKAWYKIVAAADRETLIWLKEEGLSSIKYFTRDDWHGPELAARLLQRINSRLNPEDLEYLKELIP